jgi:hypothetical protein
VGDTGDAILAGAVDTSVAGNVATSVGGATGPQAPRASRHSRRVGNTR